MKELHIKLWENKDATSSTFISNHQVQMVSLFKYPGSHIDMKLKSDGKGTGQVIFPHKVPTGEQAALMSGSMTDSE